MILEYKITDKMISLVVSISEKIGRLKEIRGANRHIDFDKACIIKNIQRILKEKNIIYPDKVILDSLISGDSIPQENVKSILPIIEFHATHLINKELDINSYTEKYNRNGYFEEIPVWRLEQIISINDFSSRFFLYSIADFCNECNNLTSDYFIEGWLINRFYKEYGIILNLAYSNYLTKQKSLNGFDYVFSQTFLLKDPLRYEFFLSVIDILLDESIKYYYELSNPKSGRVELLRGTIKEPFSRKDYRAYYNISGSAASKDLKEAVDKGILIVEGDKINARYCYKVIL